MIQNLLDGVLTGAVISLGAIGLTMVMHMLRFANFAYAELLAIGAYAALVFDRVLTALAPALATAFKPLTVSASLALATLLAMAITGASAVVVDWLVFRRIRAKADALSMVFASFGVALIIRNAITLAFGHNAQLFSPDIAFATVLSTDPLILIKADQVFVLVAALALMAAFHIVLTRTAFGFALRAVAENPTLAQVAGVRLSTMIVAVWLIGGGLSAAAGVFYTLTNHLSPALGHNFSSAGLRSHHRGRHRQRLRRGAGRLPGRRRVQPLAGGSALGLCAGDAVPDHPCRAAAASARTVRRGSGMTGVVSYLVFFATMAGILAIVVLGLNLQWGYTGLFNGGVAAFFGAGAYITMLLGGRPEPGQFGGFLLPFPVAVGGGILFAGLIAWFFGALTLRLRHDYLAIATFGVAIAFESIARNAEWLTGGAKGLRGFPRPLEATIGDNFLYGLFFLALVLAVLVAVYVGLERLTRSPYGRALRAIREDETAARSLGKNPVRLRLESFVIGSMIMGAAGGLYVAFYAYVGPQDLAPILTFQVWAMLIVGGAGNNRGAVLGAFLIWAAWTASGFALAAFAPQAMQLYTGPIQYILIGSVIVGMLLWRPQGILPEQVRQQGRN